ncbi:cupin domain-containing protein [Acidocella sp.]|uniref:cupin domain-containing protein n=1 Tax=Acidocella sp. TaxID=50710 RepID=UPI00261BDF6F|nr:cupin domain-containing protein [Acidocella sp.]
MTDRPPVIMATDAPARVKPSNYPEPFASRMAGRFKRPLGDLFGLKNFGVNLTCLAPGAVSALHHQHARQDEFIYVLQGEPTLLTGVGETQLRPGMVAGFAAGGMAHHLENRTAQDCLILEIGDRTVGDEVSYPDDDIQAVMADDGRWRFAHKDGTAY